MAKDIADLIKEKMEEDAGEPVASKTVMVIKKKGSSKPYADAMRDFKAALDSEEWDKAGEIFKKMTDICANEEG